MSSLDDVSLYLSILQKVAPEQARSEFYFFFFGGSGALGIGAGQIPKILKEFERMKNLEGVPSLGGDDFALPAIGKIKYPETLKTKDIQCVIDRLPAVNKIQDLAQKLDTSSFMVQRGYISRPAFIKAAEKCYPLAAYAVFDALANGSEFADPRIADSAITAWKAKGADGLKQVSESIGKGNANKFSAYAVFTFLLGLVGDLVVETGINGFLN